jgi:hypothetical protein
MGYYYRSNTTNRDAYFRNPSGDDDVPLITEIAESSMVQNQVDKDLLGPHELLSLCRSGSASPVMTCSILGSILAQEVIKAVSASGEPGKNVFVFDSIECEVKAFPVLPR